MSNSEETIVDKLDIKVSEIIEKYNHVKNSNQSLNLSLERKDKEITSLKEEISKQESEIEKIVNKIKNFVV